MNSSFDGRLIRALQNQLNTDIENNVGPRLEPGLQANSAAMNYSTFSDSSSKELGSAESTQGTITITARGKKTARATKYLLL